MQLKTLLTGLITFCLMSFWGYSQQVKLSQGIAITDFDYTNNEGQSIGGLKSGSGLSFQVSYHKAHLVDSTKYLINQSPMDIYLAQHRRFAQVLSWVNYDLGISFVQMNALGDIQQNAFSYQTDFLGIQGKLGVRIPLPFKLAINLQGIGSINKIVHGNQYLMNRYIDLTGDPQFSGVKIMMGFGTEVEKRFSDKLAGFVSYQYQQTFLPKTAGESTLNFKPSTGSVGIRFLI